MRTLVGEYLKVLAKYYVLRRKFKRMEQTTTEIIEENRILHEIIADLKNGGGY